MPVSYLTTLPDWTSIVWDKERRIVNRDDPFKWGGKEPPPSIGSKVTVAVNMIGAGVVRSYFVQEGFLGVLVKPDAPPDWYIKQNGADQPCHVFGAELKQQPADTNAQ